MERLECERGKKVISLSIIHQLLLLFTGLRIDEEREGKRFNIK